MDTQKLIQFKETINAANHINGDVSRPSYVIIKNDEATYTPSLSLYQLNNFDYIIVLSSYKWGSEPYVNRSAILLGMFDKYFDLISQIPINGDRFIIDVKFTTYNGSYYNAFKPILVVSDKNETIEEFKLDKGNGWKEDFPELFKLLLEKNESK